MQEMGQELAALALQEETRVLEFDERFKEHIPIGELVNLVQRGILYTESELLAQKAEGNALLQSTDSERQRYFNEKFNLVDALKIDREQYPEIKATGRFALENEVEQNVQHSTVESSLQDTVMGTYDEKEIDAKESKEKAPEETGIVSEAKNDNVPIVCYNNAVYNGGLVDAKPLTELYILQETIVVLQWHPVNANVLCVGNKDSVAKIIEFEEDNKSVVQIRELRHPFALSASAGKTTNEITCLSWSHDGEMVITGVENGEIRLWNKEGLLQNVFNFHRGPVICMKWSPDSTFFISMDVDSVAILWNVSNGTVLQHFELKGRGNKNSESLGVDIEWVDQNRFVVPGNNGAIVVYETNEDQSVGKLLGHHGAISCLSFNTEKKLLASSADDFTIRIWQGSNSNSSHCFYGHSQAITSLQWLNNDTIISASMDGTLRIWSILQNKMLGLLMIDGIPIFVAQLNHNKHMCAVGCLNGQMIIVDIQQFHYNLQDLQKKNANTTTSTAAVQLPLEIPIAMKHPPTNDSINDISWNTHDHAIAVAYATNMATTLSTV